MTFVDEGGMKGAYWQEYQTTATTFNSIGGINIFTNITELVIREQGDTSLVNELNFTNQTLIAEGASVSLGIRQVNITTAFNSVFLASFTAERTQAAQSIQAIWSIAVDGVILQNTTVTMDGVQNDSVVFQVVEGLGVGLHNISLLLRKDHTGSPSQNPLVTRDISFIHSQTVTPEGNPFVTANGTIDIDVTSTAYEEIGTGTINITFSTEVLGLVSLQLNDSSSMIDFKLEFDGANSSTFSRSLSHGNIGFIWSYNYTGLGVRSWRLLGRTNETGVSVNGDVFFSAQGFNRSVINNHAEATVTGVVAETLITSVLLNLTPASAVGAIASGTLRSGTAGTATITLTVNETVVVRDSTMTAGDTVNFFIAAFQDNITASGIYNITLTGTNADYDNVSLIAVAASSFEVTEQTTTPVINITFPPNATNQTSTFVTGTCTDLIGGISDVSVNNASWLFNESFTFVDWRFDFNQTLEDNRSITLEFTCTNPFSNTDAQNVSWNFTFIPVIIFPPPALTDTIEFTSIEQALFWIFLFFIWVVLVWMTFTFKGPNNHTIQVLNVVQLFVGITEGIGFMAFSGIIGLLIVFAAIGIFGAKVMEARMGLFS